MFKIISAEIKKIVSKPGIYILAVLLAAILIFGAFVYKPTVTDNKGIELTGITYKDKYTDFITSKKIVSDKDIDNAINSINNYLVIEQSTVYSQKEYIDFLTTKTEELYDEYRNCYYNHSPEDYIDSTRNKLVNAYTKLNEAIINAFIDSQDGSYSILSTKANYEAYKDIYKTLSAWIAVDVEQKDLEAHLIEFETKYKSNYLNSIENFKFPTLSDEFIDSYTKSTGNAHSTLTNRLNNILTEIKVNQDRAVENPDFNVKSATLMDRLAQTYIDTVNTYCCLIKYELIVNAFETTNTNEELNMLYLSDYSSFNTSSLLTRYRYLFDHNKTENDYCKPLTIGIASNNDVNAYDFTYFVLRVFSFVIIVYAIMSACHTIAGEIKEGSMRYLAIRPVSRTNLLIGKWLAIIIMSTILILFSTIIALCVGGAVYGWSTNTILTIFDGSIALTMHPIAMIGIYLISMILELVVYSLLALLLSTLFKSDLMSMTILIVLYLVNTLLPVFIQGANTWLAFYPFSHLSFYALFGSSVYATSNNFMNLVFGAKIYAGSSAVLTISLIVLIISLLTFLSIKAFKRKEL